jgi:hypothetical protein
MQELMKLRIQNLCIHRSNLPCMFFGGLVLAQNGLLVNPRPDLPPWGRGKGKT